jgi:hypothetical protein
MIRKLPSVLHDSEPLFALGRKLTDRGVPPAAGTTYVFVKPRSSPAM